MALFEPKARELVGPKTFQMSDYGYLDNSARPPAQLVRDQLEAMVANYPANHRDALIARLRADDRDHNAALLELTVHEMLRRCGYELLEVEPDVPGTPYHPDFLFRTSSGQPFYVEATTTAGESEQTQRRRRWLALTQDALHDCRHAHVRFDATIEGLPATPVNNRRLRLTVEQWLRGVGANESGIPKTKFVVYEQPGFRILVSVARTGAAGDARSKALFSVGGSASHEAPHTPIRESVVAKYRKYGDLAHPLYVAVNDRREFTGDSEFEDAAFGTVAVEADWGNGSTALRSFRVPDGFFNGSRRAPRLSGVLAFQRLAAWRLVGAKVQVMENPLAAMPLRLQNLGLRLVFGAEGRIL